MNISMEELLKKDLNNICLIDIRDKFEYNISHIPTSINIPSNFLITNPSDYLNKDKTYYLYCSSGIKSKNISNELNYLGYNTINILGGYNYYLLIK